MSGAQLDGDLVEVFIEVLEHQDLAFQHTDDTDFETELAFERRVRDYAAPKTAELPAAAGADGIQRHAGTTQGTLRGLRKAPWTHVRPCVSLGGVVTWCADLGYVEGF